MLKKNVNLFTGIAVAFLVFGKVLILTMISIFPISTGYNLSMLIESGYHIFAVFLMVYIVFYFFITEKKGKLSFSRSLLKKNFFTMISVEMLLFMIAYINYALYHPELVAPFPTDVVYPTYLGIMVIFAILGSVSRRRDRTSKDN